MVIEIGPWFNLINSVTVLTAMFYQRRTKFWTKLCLNNACYKFHAVTKFYLYGFDCSTTLRSHFRHNVNVKYIPPVNEVDLECSHFKAPLKLIMV